MLVNQDDLENLINGVGEHLHQLLIDVIGQLHDLEGQLGNIERRLDELEERKQ